MEAGKVIYGRLLLLHLMVGLKSQEDTRLAISKKCSRELGWSRKKQSPQEQTKIYKIKLEHVDKLQLMSIPHCLWFPQWVWILEDGGTVWHGAPDLGHREDERRLSESCRSSVNQHAERQTSDTKHLLQRHVASSVDLQSRMAVAFLQTFPLLALYFPPEFIFSWGLPKPPSLIAIPLSHTKSSFLLYFCLYHLLWYIHTYLS